MNPWLQLAIFAVIALSFSGSKTYSILLIAAFVNVIYFLNTTNETAGLVVGYSALDAVTAACLYRFGDSIKLYQCSLLLFASAIHFTMQMDLMHGTSIVYDNYMIYALAITVFQIVGTVAYGFYYGAGNIRRDNANRREHHYFRNVFY